MQAIRRGQLTRDRIRQVACRVEDLVEVAVLARELGLTNTNFRKCFHALDAWFTQNGADSRARDQLARVLQSIGKADVAAEILNVHQA